MGKLSLTRFANQKIMIHDSEGKISCVIRINKIKDNGCVILTFEAEQDVKISREEVFNKMYNQ